MKTLKGWLTTGILMTLLVLGTTTANAGIIVGGAVDNETQCNLPADDKTDWGIIVGGFTGIIVGGFTGVIVFGLKGETTTTNCGIIVGG